MTAPFDNIVQHLFHQPSLQSVTVGELERMAVQHPSFAAIQFLLLKKMQETAHPDFNSQLHKTTLYFNNPLWLQFLLQPQKEKSNGNAPEEAQVIIHKEEQQPVLHEVETAIPVEQEATAILPVATEAFNPAPDTMMAIAEEYNYNNAGSTEIAAENTIREPDHEGVTAIAGDYAYVPAVEEEMPVEQQSVETIRAAEPSYESTTAIAEEHSHIETLLEDTTAEQLDTEPVMHGELLYESVMNTEPPVQHGPAAIEEQRLAEHINTVEEPAEEYKQPGATETTIAAEQKTGELINDFVPATTEPVKQNKAGTPLLKTIIETPAAKDDLLFEPYHTIDYFASQGIKLNKLEPGPTDKLGKQLKSFTEWLKSMKKLPPASLDKILAANDESEVVAAANHSIETKEVITETMAEVFEKQGLHEKAVEVYRKLSLLNPGKSAYFASRIEALKQ